MSPGYSLISKLEYRASGLVASTILVIIIGGLFILGLVDKTNFFWVTLTIFCVLYMLFLNSFTDKTFLKKMEEEGRL